MILTQEEKDFLGHEDFRTPAKDDIEAYYVSYFATATGGFDGRYGNAYSPSFLSNEDQVYVDSVIATSPTLRPQWAQMVIAHEIGHVLTDAGHFTGVGQRANLMVAGPSGVRPPLGAAEEDDVTASKRLTVDQETDMRNKRKGILF